LGTLLKDLLQNVRLSNCNLYSVVLIVEDVAFSIGIGEGLVEQLVHMVCSCAIPRLVEIVVAFQSNTLLGVLEKLIVVRDKVISLDSLLFPIMLFLMDVCQL